MHTSTWSWVPPPQPLLPQVRSLDALHHMLHEASVLSSHLRGYKGAVERYATQAGGFFDAVRDFLASSGGCTGVTLDPCTASGSCDGSCCHAWGQSRSLIWESYVLPLHCISLLLSAPQLVIAITLALVIPGSPVLYEHTLTPEGMTAARAATAAASAAESGLHSAESSTAAGVAAAEAHPQDQPAVQPTSPTGSTGSAFEAEAQVPRLPLIDAAGVSRSGVVLCPGVPATAALGVAGGLTKVVPAELHLPKQHAALFR